MNIIALVVVASLLGLIPAVIAHRKGYSFLGWWVFGAALFIIALIFAICLESDPEALEERAIGPGGKRCPHCAEVIRVAARVCRYCGRDVYR